MRVEIPQKNQTKIIVTFVVVAILVILLMIFGERLSIVENNITDSGKFYTEYTSVPVENVFKYVSIKEAIDLFTSEEAILFIGFKECKWCQSYAPILNEVMMQNGVETVYYLNIKEYRANNTNEYKKLVEMLSDYLYEDDNGNKRIYVPDVYFIKEGKIVGHNNDTSVIAGADTEDYYTEQAKEDLKNKLTELTQKVFTFEDGCNDSGKGC